MTYRTANDLALAVSSELHVLVSLLLFAILLLGVSWITSRYLNGHVDRPGPLYITLLEELMAGTMVYEVQLPPLAEDDVDKRLLEVIINGGEPQSIELLKTASTTTVKAPQDSNVVLRLFNIDDAGNRSAPSEQTFVAKDTIPPAAPGEFAEIRLVAEE